MILAGGKSSRLGSDKSRIRLGRRTLLGHTYDITSLALSGKGDRFVSASDDKTLKVWNLRTGALLRTLKGHTATVISVAISPNGDRAVSGSKGELKFWDLK